MSQHLQKGEVLTGADVGQSASSTTTPLWGVGCGADDGQQTTRCGEVNARSLLPSEATVYDALANAARTGARCPRNYELEDMLDLASSSAASDIVKRLERKGWIRVWRGQKSRVVEVIATGQRTAGDADAMKPGRFRDPTTPPPHDRRPPDSRDATGAAHMAQFQPGQSGNPTGRPKIVLADGRSLRDICRENTVSAVETLIGLLVAESEAVRATAATALLDRGWGKPVQAVELDVTDNSSIGELLEQARRRADAAIVDQRASAEPSQQSIP